MSSATLSPWTNRILSHGVEPAGQLLPNDSNWRRHSAGQQRALNAAIGEVGLVAEVIVNLRGSEAWGETRGQKVLVDGHLRAALALQRGEQTGLPVAYVDLEPEEERLVLATLDPIGAMAEADQTKLAELLASLESQDEQVRALLEAIARQERIELPSTVGLVDPDEVPAVPEEPVSRPGDLWLLGGHHLLCGDSTKADDVSRLMAGDRAVLMATDPPYLVDYDGGNHPQTWGAHGTTAEQKTKHWDAYTDHEQAVGFYRDFIAVALSEALGERPAIYQWFGMMRMDVVSAAWAANALKLHQIVIWHKNRPVLGRCWYMWDYEPCAVGWIEGRQPQPARRPPANTRAVWDVDQKEGVEEGLGSVHPTIKAVELLRRPILWHTRPGELVFDGFLGSGTCLIAAEITARRCRALEISPQFVDVAILRWQRLTGKQATLEGDGRSFAELAAARRGQPEGR